MGKMFVGTLLIELYIPGSHSLKEKRHIMKGMIERARSRYNISAVEIENHDLWQRGSIGIACVGLTESGLRDLLGRICAGIQEAQGAEILGAEIEIISIP